MIQPAATASLSIPGLPGEVPMLPGAEGTEGADFSALLAMQVVQAEAPASQAPTAEPGEEPVGDPAAPTAIAGNILQPALPVASDIPAEASLPVAQPKPNGPAPRSAAAPSPARMAQAMPEPPSDDAAPETEAGTEEERTLTALARVAGDLQVPVASPVVALPPSPAALPVVAEATPAAEPAAEPRHTPSVQSILPETSPRQARASAQPRLAPLASDPLRAEPAQPAARIQPAPAEEVRVQLALPRVEQAAALPKDEPRPAPRPLEVALPEVAAIASSPSPQHQAAPALPAATPAPQVRPHDFAALVERIAQAREAAAPQAVSITVAHRDFGPVRLHFWPEEAVLNVSMASADPGFARAAALAPAPVLPVTAGEQAGFTASRNDSAPGQAGSQGGQSQSRGGFAEQRSEGQPHANPSPRGPQQRPAPRPGIFA